MAYLFVMDKPIRKSQIQVFKDAGYLMPDHFFKSGIFYIQKQGLIANSSYGVCKINVRCSGECEEKLKELEIVLEKAINS